ncbi:sensor histidine kinase [Streptomonospora algeriensis]|uniref:histidine kinase n=1 Tax=Streptomonospora algeriensis TaxID=995084 RepID=A0ABW3BAB9_9ACTN
MTTLRRLPELWHRLDVVARDLPLALLLAAMSFLPALEGHETQVGDLPARPFDAPAGVALALLCLPLAVRRRWPAACIALVSLGFLIAGLGSYHLVAGTALPIALLSTGLHLDHHRRTAVLLLSAAYASLAVVLARLGSTEGLEGFVTFYLLLAVAWCAGAWLRSTRIAEAERRRRVAEETRTAERAHIARDLHDVVTHHVMAIIVQAEAARYLTATPDRLDQVLTVIAATGRRATTDLRYLLDLLNPDHRGTEPSTPPAGGFLALVKQTRQAGQPVEFTEEGTPAESTGSADLVAYRVVQEALTNALKYAGGNPTSVRVHHGEQEITVAVDTEGSGSGARPGLHEGGGRGLAGLRERVDVLGGEFSAGRRDDGLFAVRARIPTGSAS